MSDEGLSRKENSKTSNHNKQITPLRHKMYTTIAAFSGLALGAMATLGFMSSYYQSQLASQAAALKHQVVQMKPADLTSGQIAALTPNDIANICGIPTASGVTAPSSFVATTGNITPSVPSTVPTTPGGNNFVTKLVTGNLVTQKVNISNTGTKSTNTANVSSSITTNVSNNNNINISSNNQQNATTGNATNKQNTTSGNATTGQSTNSNSTSMTIKVSN